MRLPLSSLSAMRAFEAYLRLGTMSAACEELGGYPSGISRHIQNLEAELGVRLLTGARRHVRPTQAGRAFAERLTTAFDIISRAVEDLQAASPAAADDQEPPAQGESLAADRGQRRSGAD